MPFNPDTAKPNFNPDSKRFFLDVFAGRLHPVTAAAISLGLDCLPFDVDYNSTRNILNDEVFETLLKMCWPGIIALIMLARLAKNTPD